jgi:hypothetical protein
MSIKIAELLMFIESVREREEQKKLARKKDVSPEPLAPLQLPESLEVPVLERSEEKPKRGRKKKALSPSHS